MATVVLSSSATSTSGVSISGDDIFEVRQGQNQVAGTDLSATDLQQVYIHPQWAGSFGTSASPVLLAVSNTTTSSTPTVWINCPSGRVYMGAGGNNIDFMRISAGDVTLTAGTIGTVYVNGGRVTIGASCTVTNLILSGGTLTVQDGTAITALTVNGGTLYTYRDVTTATQSGGLVFLWDTAPVTTFNLSGDGELRHQSSGTVGTLTMTGRSRYTVSGALTNPTITTANLNSPLVLFTRRVGSVTASVGTTNNNGGASILESTTPLEP